MKRTYAGRMRFDLKELLPAEHSQIGDTVRRPAPMKFLKSRYLIFLDSNNNLPHILKGTAFLSQKIFISSAPLTALAALARTGFIYNPE